MATLSNQDDFIKTALRLPRDVHAAIQKAAEESGRSMNSEIVARLQASFQRSSVSVPSGSDGERIKRLMLAFIDDTLKKLDREEAPTDTPTPHSPIRAPRSKKP